jgi:formylglycine-generating enzyme
MSQKKSDKKIGSAHSNQDAYPGELIRIPGMLELPEEQKPFLDVAITRTFQIGKTQVTNSEYCAALNWANEQGLLEVANTKSVRAYGQVLIRLGGNEIGYRLKKFYVKKVQQGQFKGKPATKHPVKKVSWYGAACYCDWMSKQESLPPFYEGKWNSLESRTPYGHDGYRLPTEAEWEFTAGYRYGRKYPWGPESPTSSHANYGNHVGWTSPVGSYPNGAAHYGCLDMSGNVREWSNDWYTEEIDQLRGKDLEGARSGSYRMVRGGSWNLGESSLEIDCRNLGHPATTESYFGFRILKSSSKVKAAAKRPLTQKRQLTLQLIKKIKEHGLSEVNTRQLCDGSLNFLGHLLGTDCPDEDAVCLAQSEDLWLDAAGVTGEVMCNGYPVRIELGAVVSSNLSTVLKENSYNGGGMSELLNMSPGSLDILLEEIHKDGDGYDVEHCVASDLGGDTYITSCDKSPCISEILDEMAEIQGARIIDEDDEDYDEDYDDDEDYDEDDDDS